MEHHFARKESTMNHSEHSCRTITEDTLTSKPKWFERLWGLIAALAVVFAVATVLHIFLRVSSTYPFVAVDDALANVSVTLENSGTNGFISSPVQGGTGSLRHVHFLNYGPLPFYFGAILDWLFGSSYTVLRFIHPLGLLLAIGLSAVVFRRFWHGGTLISALLSLGFFWSVQWPMFRPDIGVVIAVAICIAASTSVLMRPTRLGWLALGFGAGAAVTTHQIAWAIAPWAGVMFIWAVMRMPRAHMPAWQPRQLLVPLVWTGFGAFIALALYLHAIGYRIGDVLDLWLWAAQLLTQSHQMSWWTVFSRHFLSAWQPVPKALLVSVTMGVAASFVSLIWAWRTRSNNLSRDVLALVVPPLTASAVYQASLGFYGNFHSGYHLVSYAATAWACGAGITGLVVLLGDWNLRAGKLLRATGILFLSGLLIGQSLAITKQGPAWAANPGQVSFQEYSGHVFDEIPIGASVWGSIIFGLESGKKNTLIQFGDGLALANDFLPTERWRIAPDFIIANDLLMYAVLTTIRNGQSMKSGGGNRHFLDQMQEFIPGAKYRLVKIVHGMPYGTTRIYQRTSLGSPDLPITVAAYDNQRGVWDQAIGQLEPTKTDNALPAEFSFTFGETLRGTAKRSLALTLPSGKYVIHVKLAEPAKAGGVVIATLQREIAEVGGDLNFRTFDGPYSVGDEWVKIFVETDGSPFFVTDLNGAAGNFDVPFVQQVVGRTPSSVSIPLPPPSEWKPWSPDISVAPQDNGTVKVTGSPLANTGQLVSPPIEIPAGANVRVTVPIVSNYDYRLSMINEDLNGYVLLPVRNVREIAGTVNANGRFRLVVSSAEQTATGSARTFLISPGNMDYTVTAGRYIDRLVACRQGILNQACSNRH
jgi:hypothetical protein